MITSDQINPFITDSAILQIKLISDNDYTLEGQYFRIKIGGKGCGGFTYDTGFSIPHPDDLVIKKFYPALNYELILLIDPFTAYYTQQFTLDYLLDPQSNEEGFVLVNAADGDHKGKFFKDTSKLPPWANK